MYTCFKTHFLADLVKIFNILKTPSAFIITFSMRILIFMSQMLNGDFQAKLICYGVLF